jgi:hypothetical protein
MVLSLNAQTRSPESSQEKSPAPSPATGADTRLPVKRVVLYKNGVGYFEHSARVHGNQDLSIDFTSGQLNDVLKSLTAVDLGGGQVSAIRYNSIAPLDERLKALRLPFGEQVTRADFLTALRGARVEVRDAAVSATGRLLSVEKERRTNAKGDFYDATEFSIVTDAGEMRNFELGPEAAVRLAERDLTDEVGRYLNLVGSSRARDLRRMTLTAAGTGDRDIFVSYISEVPIWKSTYRILLPAKPNQKPLLQGWAIVDNTVGEDWKDVQLSLIAGSPQSFVEQISQPYYARRPVIEMPTSMMLMPQTHEGTMTSGTGEGALSPSGQGSGVGAGSAGGYGAIGGPRLKEPGRNSLDGQLSPPPPAGGAIRTAGPMAAAEAVEVAEAAAAQHAEAEGSDLGDYFEYNVKQKITIGKNQSALVPILQSRIDAERVSLWNEDSNEIRRALWLTNSSGLTLDSGTFNILDGDTFAGEGLVETIHPAERRLISYAADPALRITVDEETSEKPATHIHIAKGVMYVTREQRDSRKYTLHNSDTQPRQVVIEHPARAGWKLVEGPPPEETSASFLRFRVAVGPDKTEELTIGENHPEETHVELGALDDREVALITQEKQITPAMQEIFHKVLDEKNKVDGLGAEVSRRQKELDAITKDQARVRENMKALKGSPEEKALLERYAKQLDSQEDRLGRLNREITDLEARQAQARQDLNQTVQAVVLDENL